MNKENALFKMLVLIVITIFTTGVYAQGYEIKVSLYTKHYDSLHLKAFDGKKDFVDMQVLPMAKTVVFKSKTSLEPGIYLLQGDTIGIVEILVSDKKSQQLSIVEKDSVWMISVLRVLGFILTHSRIRRKIRESSSCG